MNQLKDTDISRRIANKYDGKVKLVQYGNHLHNPSKFQCNICGRVWTETAKSMLTKTIPACKCPKPKQLFNYEDWAGGHSNDICLS